jgi:hypothetical protein
MDRRLVSILAGVSLARWPPCARAAEQTALLGCFAALLGRSAVFVGRAEQDSVFLFLIN